MSASFASALDAAREAAAAQHYPQGALYVVATPIGNLADITLRALHVLQLADTVACEDTRHTQALLRAYGIDKGSAQCLAVHQHNEAEAAQNVVLRLQQGQRVAYVSDAGTPGVSDPGARLVAAVQAAGLRAVPLPGASSVTTALSVAGAVAHDSEHGGFVFAGFLPTKTAERATAIAQQLAPEPRCVVLLEAPHRIGELAQALAALGERPVTLARELTKQFEEVTTQPAKDLKAWLDGSPQRSRGEFVVLLHPVAVATDDSESLRVLRLLVQELPLKTAVRLAAEITGAPRNQLYNTALAWKREGAEQGEDGGDGKVDGAGTA
ncbi:MAG: 16S rRNA (cytidine(1402)-2'-O)-methyltransferase [Acidovorax sp.]|uniref:16S rRNA (cytidine(1402)-2'-O)-methyltransferase n=1 Tax=Acidovorax sp. TaxID=1872122 RepID=UPI000AF29C23|nr:16S rRNA (cytidine(1402)-2'-O)-methyltransferase [Acidovorax sp.]MDH4425303.1 16S rRNA (cytidine(1402)-2'-O)-methyltransferase [Acidovorax sp.]